MSVKPVLPANLVKPGCTEDAEQTALFCWAALMVHQYGVGCLSSMFAIPNGGLRDPITASRLKQQGVKPGVPDVMLPVPWGRYAGLFIEMKRRTKHNTSDEQVEYVKVLRAAGYCVIIAYGYVEAIAAINMYLGLQLPIL